MHMSWPMGSPGVNVPLMVEHWRENIWPSDRAYLILLCCDRRRFEPHQYSYGDQCSFGDHHERFCLNAVSREIFCFERLKLAKEWGAWKNGEHIPHSNSSLLVLRSEVPCVLRAMCLSGTQCVSLCSICLFPDHSSLLAMGRTDLFKHQCRSAFTSFFYWWVWLAVSLDGISSTRTMLGANRVASGHF